MAVPIIPCGNCKHLILNNTRTCKAFPDGIPKDILIGVNNHTEPFKGDNGIQFEPIDSPR